MKLHQTLLLTALLYLAGTSYTWSANYTYDYFSSKGCESQGCWFKVITREDRGGLNCRARPSLRSSVRKIVHYGNRVLAKDWEISNRGYTFFKLNRGCYIRATNNRLRFFKRKGNNIPNTGSNYTYDYFSSKGCESESCVFKVITREDRGGLNCRRRASLRSSVVKIVPYGHWVLAKALVISSRGYAFFRLTNGCYMRATSGRLAYYEEVRR
jgi:hypothetical protein